MIDAMLAHVKNTNEECAKQEKQNYQLKDLQRCRQGILDFNMVESCETIKLKVISNLEELKLNLIEPANTLSFQLQKQLKIAKDFMLLLKSFKIPSDPEEITNEILRTQ